MHDPTAIDTNAVVEQSRSLHEPVEETQTMLGGENNMPDKSEEILSAITTLRNELMEKITGAVRILQETISAAQAVTPGKAPTPAPAPAISLEQNVLAQNLKQYCLDALPQLEPLLEQAKQKGQDVAAVQRLVSRLGEHANSTQDDLAGKGALFLRTEIEKLQTTITMVKANVGSGPKSATAAIPFPPTTQRQTPETTATKKSASAAVARRATLSAAESSRSNPAAARDKRSMAASAKAS